MGDDSNFWGLAERDTRQVILYNRVRANYMLGKFVMVLPEAYHFVSADLKAYNENGIAKAAREFGADTTVPIIKLSKHKRNEDANRELEDAAKDFYAHYEIMNLNSDNWRRIENHLQRAELDTSWEKLTQLKTLVDTYFQGLDPRGNNIFDIKDAGDIEELVKDYYIEPYQNSPRDATLFTEQIYDALDINWNAQEPTEKEMQNRRHYIKTISETLNTEVLKYLLNFQAQKSRTIRTLDI
jgi:hypothetical protein